MANILVIPARRGSKRIPNKNFVEVLGKSMIEHAITLAKSTDIFDEIIISLDSHERDEIFKDLGVTLYYRSSSLGLDQVGTIDVIKDVITVRQFADDINICCLYPASFLISASRVMEGLATLLRNPYQFVFCCQPTYANPLRMFSLRQDLNDGIEFLDLKSIGVNTQTLPNYFIDAGQFYWGKVATWVNQNQVLNPSSVPIVLERWETIDIDYPEDLEVAVAILIKRESKEGK